MSLYRIKLRRTLQIFTFEIDEKLNIGDFVLLKTIWGIQIGNVVNNFVEKLYNEKNITFMRKMTEYEVKEYLKSEDELQPYIYQFKNIAHKYLSDLRVVTNEYTFNREQLIFYFVADARLDFRDFVKIVNQAFGKKIQLLQIKHTDAMKILNAFGRYGKEIY